MKIVIAPDSFKGSLTAWEACDAIARGILREIPDADVLSVPMADGGEGTVQSVVDAEKGVFCKCAVSGPLGQPVMAEYGVIHGGTAVIEMAAASGLYLVLEEERNPLIASTYGTGQLIADALGKGCRKFLLGIGGSATNDGGAGMAQALGYKLTDAGGAAIPPGGGGLSKLARIDSAPADKRILESEFIVACDVTNPLCGSNGASAVFGPQKGATPEAVRTLDQNLLHFAKIIGRDLGVQAADIPGAGAAGGLGAGSIAFLNAALQSGVDIVSRAVRLEEKMRGASLVITGEGRCDAQTAGGKTAAGVAKTACRLGIPVVLIGGGVGAGAEALYPYGVKGIFSIAGGPISLDDAMKHGAALLEESAARIIHLIAAEIRL